MGRIRAPHGVKGWVKVQPFTQEVGGLLEYGQWWIGREGEWQQIRVADGAINGATVIAKLEGCDDREAAAAYKGAEVGVPREELPGLQPNEYYQRDLLGARVSNREGEALGEVTGFIETGANLVLVLRGERERLVPFISDVIVEVDVAGRHLVVDWGKDY